MKLSTVEEIQFKRSELESELEAQVRNLDRLKKRMEVGGILAVLVSAVILIWGISSGGDVRDIAVGAVVAGVAGFTGPTIVFGVSVVSVGAGVAFGTGAAAGAAAASIFGATDAGIAGVAVASALGFVTAILAEYFLGKNEEKIQELEQKLKLLSEISPEKTPYACNDFATLVDQVEPLAVDLHRQVKEAGRRPTLGEVEELKSEVEKQNAPPSPEERAKAACERLFLAQVKQRGHKAQ